MAQQGKVNQYCPAVRIFEGDRGIHRNGCGASATFGAEKCKNTRLACPAASASPGGTETGESLEERRRKLRLLQLKTLGEFITNAVDLCARVEVDVRFLVVHPSLSGHPRGNLDLISHFGSGVKASGAGRPFPWISSTFAAGGESFLSGFLGQ